MVTSNPEEFRQIYNLENHILVESDYDNIIIIDPNKVVDSNNKILDRNIQQENLVMYANLETKIIPRTKLAVGESFDNVVNNTTIASLSSNDESLDINFLKPKGKNFFDTSWSDEFTGRGSRQGLGANQNVEVKSQDDGKQVFNRRVSNYEDTQTLGIKDINVKISNVGIPSVDMTLIDVRGRSLFEQGENSIYSVFFNLPYPTFYLTLKGYYGKAIRYQLNLMSFNAKFEPSSGNFEISLKFLGRNSALLADSIIAFGKHAPKMFITEVIQDKASGNSSSTGSKTSDKVVKNTTKGRQKLDEVYNIYKSKNLIDKNFPHLTLEDFIIRVKKIETDTIEGVKKENMDLLNNLSDFQTNINELKQQIFINPLSDFLDTSERLVVGDQIYYPFLESLDKDGRNKKITDLEAQFNTLIKKLQDNKNFGTNGKYKLPGSTTDQKSNIDINLNFKDIYTNLSLSNPNIDFKLSYELNYGVTPSDNELAKYKSEFYIFNNPIQINLNNNNPVNGDPIYFKYGEKPNTINDFIPESFLDKINKLNSGLNKVRLDIEQALTNQLSNLIVNGEGGLGFQPTIRNVFAVLFAGLDSFYRLMEDVHLDAWSQRKNPVRLHSILSPQKSNGTDYVDVNSGTQTLSNENTVYPWPQYYDKEQLQDGSESYTIKYPGDVTAISQTKGFNYKIWPEIAFTEDFIRASLEKDTPTQPQVNGNDKLDINIMPVGAIEYPFSVTPYSDPSEVSYFYEIFERSYLATHYSNLNRGQYKNLQIDKILSDIDGDNIISSLKMAPNDTLSIKLKNITSNYQDYFNNLKSISSNGSGPSWTTLSNSDYNTPYISNYFNSSYNAIYSVDTLVNGNPSEVSSPSVGGNVNLIKNLKDFINGTNSKSEYFLDIYPLNNLNWLKTNLQDGSSINTVTDFLDTKNYTFINDKKVIGRLNESDTNKNINLFINNYWRTNYNQPYLTNDSVYINSQTTLTDFYKNRINNPKNWYITESVIEYGNNYSGNVETNIQTTSLINTPYFINALQKGVDLSRVPTNKDPYVALGYLYLNSMPLITTKEKLKQTVDQQDPTELEYLAATFNKFSSIHRLPYSWVLKYGSIWHRYKTYIDKNVDILDDVWVNFDYKKNYDPINSLTTTPYSGSWVGNIILQDSSIVNVNNTFIQNDVMGVGFYPKVINDVFRFCYNKDLSILTNPSANNFIYERNFNGLNVVSSLNFNADNNFDDGNLLRKLNVKNYFEYFVKPNKDNNYLVVPSMGGLQFNQSIYECINKQGKKTQEMFDNTSVYNGSVRTLWGVSQFGYYNNELIKKPKYNEYIKSIDVTANKKQKAFDLKSIESNYSNIDELFAIFEPTILDEFETMFLNFCNPNQTVNDLILKGENTTATITNKAQVKNLTSKSLIEQIKSLLLLPIESATLDDNNPVNNGKILAEAQIKNFGTKVTEFLNFDCILKMGNPSNFNRKSFNYFTDNANFKPVGGVTISPYIKGTLPGDGTNITLLQSNTLNTFNVDAWKSLKKYVCDFEIDKLKYTDSGSTITDFFIDNNVEFTKSNIETLYPLIRLYATQKLKDNTLNKTKFSTLINDYITTQNVFNGDVLTGTISYLNKNLPDGEIKIQQINSATSGNVSKLEHYTTFKTLNDKWIAGTDFLNRTLFEDFLFLDRANRDIGNVFTIDLKSVAEDLESNPNITYLSLVSKILDNNNFVFFKMPAYVNFYGIQDAVKVNKPVPVEVPNSLFGTYLDVDYLDSRPKFVCVYIGKTSEFVATDAKFVKYRDDAFDLRKTDNPLRTSDGEGTDFSKKNKVVGFSVDYGTQNQNIFKSVSMDMSEKKNTAESIKMNAEIGESGSGNKVAQQSISLYSIYKSRSYTCKVDCMGCATIQPTMYFNLRHVPLFYGPYWIKDVSHSVSSGKFDTSFTGIRMPLYSLPMPNSLLDSANTNYLQYYKEILYKGISQSDVNNTTSKDVVGNSASGGLQGNNETCQKQILFPDKPFVDMVTTFITFNELKDKINNVINESILKVLYYGIVSTKFLNELKSNVISSPNNNIYNISATYQLNQNVSDTIQNQICVTTALYNQEKPYPYFDFTNVESCLDVYNTIVSPFLPIIKDLINSSTLTEQSDKISYACAIFTLFWDQARYVELNGSNVTGTYNTLPSTKDDFINRYNDKYSKDTKFTSDYDNYVKIYKDAINAFSS